MTERLYFAYGSNLNLDQMWRRCPEAILLGKGFLNGYRLEYRGVLDIERRSSARVPGAVFLITERCERALDIYEGFPSYYGKIEKCKINMVDSHGDEDGSLFAFAYSMQQEHKNRLCPPADGYHRCVMGGYRDIGLNMIFLENALQRSLQLKIKRKARV